MNAPTEIIVYRNPLEKLVWDSLLNGDPITIFMFAALGGASILAFTYLNGWWTREQGYRRLGKPRPFCIGIAWLAVACFLFYKLFFI